MTIAATVLSLIAVLLVVSGSFTRRPTIPAILRTGLGGLLFIAAGFVFQVSASDESWSGWIAQLAGIASLLAAGLRYRHLMADGYRR